jgi:hypothetical protein
VVKLPEDSGFPAFVAQRIEHLTTDQKVGGSSPSKRTCQLKCMQASEFWLPSNIEAVNGLELNHVPDSQKKDGSISPEGYFGWHLLADSSQNLLLFKSNSASR